MVTKTNISQLASTQDAAILKISAVMTPILSAHGEANLLAGVAHALGQNRIFDAASRATPANAVEVDKDVPDQPIDQDEVAENSTENGVTIIYYVAGCDGAKKLAKDLGRAVFKIGYTSKPDPDTRIEGLEAVSYGGWSAADAKSSSKPHEGWDVWNVACHKPVDTAHVSLPENIKIKDGLWVVALPPGVKPATFDRIVTAAMMSRQLAFWATSGEGRVHCQERGTDPQTCVRFARDKKNGIIRPVEELYIYNPRRDAAWLATILVEALAIVAGKIKH